MLKNMEFGMSEFTIYTGWISTNDREQLIENISSIRSDFLKLATSIDKDIKGIHTEFYELDADDFGTSDKPKEVIKYKVTFMPLEEVKFTEKWRD